MKNVPTKEVIHLEFASGISATLKIKPQPPPLASALPKQKEKKNQITRTTENGVMLQLKLGVFNI